MNMPEKLSDQLEILREKFNQPVESIWENPLSKNLYMVILLLLSIGVGIFVIYLVDTYPRWYVMALFFCIFSGIVIFIQPYFGILIFYLLAIIRIEDKIWGIEDIRLSLIVGVLTLVAWLVSLFREKETGFVRDKRNYLIFGLWCTMALSVWFADNRQPCFKPFVAFTKMFIFYGITINLIKTKKYLDILLWMIILVFGIFCTARLIAFTLGGYSSPVQGPGIQGPMTDTNHFAAALSMILPLAFFLLYTKKGIIKKMVLGAISPIIIIVIMHTFSRGGFLSLILVITLILLKMRNKLLILPFAGMLLIGGVLVAPTGYNERISTIKNYQEDSSAMSRISLWKRAISMMSEQPITGVGLGNFYWLASEYNPSPINRKVVHNAYLQIGVESGVVSMGLFILLILTSLWDLLQLRIKAAKENLPKWISYYSHMLEISLISYAIAAIFLSIEDIELFYMVIAMVVSLRYIVNVDVQHSICKKSSVNL